MKQTLLTFIFHCKSVFKQDPMIWQWRHDVTPVTNIDEMFFWGLGISSELVPQLSEGIRLQQLLGALFFFPEDTG